MKKSLKYVLPALLVCLHFTAYSQRGTLDVNSGWVEANKDLTITANPIQYSQLERWSGDTNNAVINDHKITLSITSSVSLTAHFNAIRTTNGNVPYEWIANWTNENFETVVADDWDNDGFSNIKEYWSGTNPTDNNSFLNVSKVFSKPDGMIELLWFHSYVHYLIPNIVVQHTTNLSSKVWNDSVYIAPVNGTNAWSDTKSTNKYYRLIIRY